MAESAEDRAHRIVSELRAATSEAAGVLKDLQRVIKEARGLADGFVAERFSEQLEKTAAAAVAELKQQNDRFIEAWAESRKGACDEATAHMRDDWRLAVAVNSVGHNVMHALQETAQYPEYWKDIPSSIPNEISPAFMAGHSPNCQGCAHGDHT